MNWSKSNRTVYSNVLKLFKIVLFFQLKDQIFNIWRVLLIETYKLVLSDRLVRIDSWVRSVQIVRIDQLDLKDRIFQKNW